MENDITANAVPNREYKMSNTTKKTLLILNGAMLAIGNCGGPLLQRLYFIKGGKRIWISSFLQTAGWPFLILPLIISYFYRRTKRSPQTKLVSIKPPLILRCAVLGVLTGVDDYLAAYGVSCLPVSTSALIIATQLAFTAGFAFLLVKQRFTAFIINAVFLLSVGAVVLAFDSGTDRLINESSKEYYVGFFMTLGASALYGFVLPMIELTYKRAKQAIDYTLVIEMQVVIGFFATMVCTIGMLVNHDFKAIPREAEEFELGEVKYYVTLILSGILWQFFFLGGIGVIFCGSSLLSAIIIATLLPVTESLAVLLFHERFHVDKAISLTLSLWGFISYFYGEIKLNKKNKLPHSNVQSSQN